MITLTRKSISPKCLEIIYDILPLKLHLEHSAISSYTRLKEVLTDTMHPKTHIAHWKQRITNLGIHIPETDKITKLNLHNKFVVNTQTFGPEYKKYLMHSQLNVYTDGSKTNTGTGAGYVVFDQKEMIHKDYIPLAPTATVYQAELLAIKYAAVFLHKMKKTLKPKYVKFFSDSRAALPTLNNFKTSSTIAQDTVNALNTLGSLTQRITLNWIKAHNEHKGNEYADEMANLAARCTQEHQLVPIAHKLFKAHLKTAIYAEWHSTWTTDPSKFKHTKIFFPRMDPKYSKLILKLNRTDLKLLIEIISGHTYLKAFSTKISPLSSTHCRFCNTEDETIMHLLQTCPTFTVERYTLNLDRFSPMLYNNENLTWSIPLLLKFFQTPKLLEALTSPHT